MATTEEINQLFHRVALVTGAGRGIGKFIAERLIKDGWLVSLGARDPSNLVDIFGPENEQRHYARYDAEDFATLDAWVEDAVAKFGRIDALVNNAGCGAVDTNNLMTGTVQEANKVMTVNCWAPWYMMQLCGPHLKKSPKGQIMCINSLSGIRVNGSNNAIYNMSKHALMGLAETARFHFAQHGVLVTSLCPGWVNTELAAHSKVPPEDRTQPEDIGCLVAFLLASQPKTMSIGRIAMNCEYEAGPF